jgi:dihydroxyacetone kinase-like predicted kinase
MSLTMRAALAEVPAREFGAVSDLGKIIAHGALMGARGNSGVILSQILRGLARGMDAKTVLQAQDLALAFTEGAATAYKGVMKPVEGTILTGVRDAAQAATAVAGAGGTIREVLEKAVAERRPRWPHAESAPGAGEAGVVDAAGRGDLHSGGDVALPAGAIGEALPRSRSRPNRTPTRLRGYKYDTQFIVQGTALDVDAIRSQIATMGDSVLVVGDQYTVKVHVHCDHPPGAGLRHQPGDGHPRDHREHAGAVREFRAAHEAEWLRPGCLRRRCRPPWNP